MVMVRTGLILVRCDETSQPPLTQLTHGREQPGPAEVTYVLWDFSTPRTFSPSDELSVGRIRTRVRLRQSAGQRWAPQRVAPSPACSSSFSSSRSLRRSLRLDMAPLTSARPLPDPTTRLGPLSWRRSSSACRSCCRRWSTRPRRSCCRRPNGGSVHGHGRSTIHRTRSNTWLCYLSRTARAITCGQCCEKPSCRF